MPLFSVHPEDKYLCPATKYNRLCTCLLRERCHNNPIKSNEKYNIISMPISDGMSKV